MGKENESILAPLEGSNLKTFPEEYSAHHRYVPSQANPLGEGPGEGKEFKITWEKTVGQNRRNDSMAIDRILLVNCIRYFF